MHTKRYWVLIPLSLLFGLVVAVFWQQEMRYLLPTPVPTGYQSVLPNEPIDLIRYLDSSSSKPVLLHFFSADCPCSRFNIDHFRYLESRYRDSIDFYVVLPGEGAGEAASQFEKQYDLSIPVLIDQNEELAKACGVYSTPQVAIISRQHQLYYRGNYNRARYCTAKSTSYAELALKSLLQGGPPPVFVELATQSYGCQLPSEKDNDAWF